MWINRTELQKQLDYIKLEIRNKYYILVDRINANYDYQQTINKRVNEDLMFGELSKVVTKQQSQLKELVASNALLQDRLNSLLAYLKIEQFHHNGIITIPKND